MKSFVIAFLVLTLGLVAPAQQATKAKTQTLKKKLTTVQQKKKEVKSKLHNVKVQVIGIAADVEKIDNKIVSVEDQIIDTKSRLNKSKKEQSRLVVELDKAHKKLLEKRDTAAHRIRSMYMSGDETVMSVLIGARDVSDFAARKSILERIAKRDHQLFDDVKTLRDQVAVKKRRQDAVVDEVAELKARQQMQQQELKGVQAQKRTVLNHLRAQRDDLEEELEEMERESSKIEAQIRAYMQASGGRVTPYKGRFLLPVNGRFSSPFGYRIHPISHVRKLHTGQDIAAPSGTTIKAAGPGIVISASWRGGYGNCLIIDHGGGISTLYGHCSRIYVHAGQRVQAGDKVAAVGSTGYSTGPHCHFEVRINGSPVNPMPYVGR